jgi:hypothetical protein
MRRCARSDGGRVACWEGATILAGLEQEGYSDIETSDTSVCGARGDEVVCWSWGPVPPVHMAVDAVALAQADGGFCALGSDGRVRCWRGACNAPVEVAGVEDAVALAGSCALRRDGRALCWPARWCASRSASPVPHEVAGDVRFTALAATAQQACGRTLDGGLACWTTAGSEGPPQLIRELASVEAFAVGDRHGCARNADGAVSCWGDNGSHQLGEPHNTMRVAAPVTVVADASELGVGVDGGCVVRADERVWCWGDRGENGWDGAPRPVPGISGAYGLAVREAGACVRRRGASPMCWDTGEPPTTRPWPDAPSRPIVRLRLSPVSSAACAVYADAIAECYDVLATPPRRTLRRVRDVAFCGSALCVVAPTGDVRCWDRTKGERVGFPIVRVDQDAELRCSDRLACIMQVGYPVLCRPHKHPPPFGVDSRIDDRPLARNGAIDGSEQAVALSWYGGHLCLLAPGGEVACTSDADTPVPVPGIRGAVQVGVGLGHACVRHDDGAVTCWGDSSRGAAGVGSSAATEMPVRVNLAGVAAVASPAGTPPGSAGPSAAHRPPT